MINHKRWLLPHCDALAVAAGDILFTFSRTIRNHLSGEPVVWCNAGDWDIKLYKWFSSFWWQVNSSNSAFRSSELIFSWASARLEKLGHKPRSKTSFSEKNTRNTGKFLPRFTPRFTPCFYRSRNCYSHPAVIFRRCSQIQISRTRGTNVLTRSIVWKIVILKSTGPLTYKLQRELHNETN